MKKNILTTMILAMLCTISIPAAALAYDIESHWKFCDNPNKTSGACGETYYFKMTESKRTITIVNECGKNENGPFISNVVKKGNKISFDMKVKNAFETEWKLLKYTGTISGKEMKGEYTDDILPLQWTAENTGAAPSKEECRPFHILQI